jgi:NhaP-type Na+/H+ or K+/H+ antiporter
VAATPIVTGSVAEQNLPDRIRRAISFESGANDGLAYLFVFLPFLLHTRPQGEALSHWLVHSLLWEVGAAAILGLLIGSSAGRFLQFAERRKTMEPHWRVIYTVAMGLLAVGTGRLIGSDEVLVVFVAGVAFAQVVSASDRGTEEYGQEAVNRFFAIPIFVVLGTALPWEGWAALGWKGVACAVAILLLRRMPVVLLLRPILSAVRSTPEALFMGWFGPIAVAALYYASLMEHKLKEPLVWDVTSLIICASVVAHGTTGAPLTKLFGQLTRGRGARRD